MGPNDGAADTNSPIAGPSAAAALRRADSLAADLAVTVVGLLRVAEATTVAITDFVAIAADQGALVDTAAASLQRERIRAARYALLALDIGEVRHTCALRNAASGQHRARDRMPVPPPRLDVEHQAIPALLAMRTWSSNENRRLSAHASTQGAALVQALCRLDEPPLRYTGRRIAAGLGLRPRPGA